MNPFTVSSRFARKQGYDLEVAIACEMGLLTLRRPDGAWGRDWRITRKGIQFMEQKDE